VHSVILITTTAGLVLSKQFHILSSMGISEEIIFPMCVAFQYLNPVEWIYDYVMEHIL